MKPEIQRTTFGSITVDGEDYDHDIIIRLGGNVKKRKKKLSKSVYGTSHIVSLGEIENLYEHGATRLIVGTGQHGILRISEEARDYLQKKDCTVNCFATPEAVKEWNQADLDGTIGLFHITC